ncbi:MAG: cupin domain-containing protein [Acidobacteria bacterium]|nr:cupin domain-containing protein [Acidobacteriota bacterium]MCA1627151.1 cupin domain-containing protein [Acidobacteriota bacterium]
MAVLLEGGCRVSPMNDGLPRQDGSLLSLRVLEFDPGKSPELCNDDLDEVLFSLSSCKIMLGELTHEVEPESGVFISARATFRVENRGKDIARFVSVQCPATAASPPPIVRLADQRAMPTADRWYRVLIDSEVTQFVGSIPPGRAPDHFHEYEEVLFILRGEGRLWTEDRSTPIAYGSCIYLPRKQVHCVENTGTGELRLLGVFYPAGSPAVRYEPSTQNP